MKYLFIILLFVSSVSYGQLSLVDAKAAAAKYQLGTYDYHEQFIGHAGYGAPLILTSDGGTAFFGDYEGKEGNGGQLVKLDKNGKEEWNKVILPQFDDIESQSVIQDNSGNYYVFVITYDYKKYRGGPERVVYFDKSGTILWDKTIGAYEMINSPMFSYISLLEDGRIYIRGHIAPKKPSKGEDPVYRYWEGWIDNKGKLTQKTGDVIVWENKEWEKLFSPEKQ